MKSNFDAIVVGLGAMGSAAAYHLARRGKSVLGIDAFTPPHSNGSSHGESRIIRQAYFEDPAYVPLVLRAYELWDDLQEEAGEELLRITGGLSIGPRQGKLVAGSLKSAARYGLAHDLLDQGEMRRRFPQFALAEDEVAFYEEKVGYLRPEECIRQHLRGAAKRGARFRFDEPVTAWTASQSGEGVSVTTAQQTYRASALILSVGPWFAELVPELAAPVFASRRVVFWLKPVGPAAAFAAGTFPIYMWEPAEAPFFYGFPAIGAAGDAKVGIHSGREVCTPTTIDRVIHSRDEQAIRSAIRSRIPALNGEVTRAETCMYTMTPDEHFIVDRHPGFPQVSVAGGFSGHGFKFSSVIGEMLAGLATAGETGSRIGIFAASRSGHQAGSLNA